MKEKNKIIIFQILLMALLTVIFTGIVFFIKNYFFSNHENVYIEQNFIDPVIEKKDDINPKKDKIQEEKNDDISAILQEHYRSASPFYFQYFPEKFEESISSYTLLVSDFLNSKYIKKQVSDLRIELHQTKYDVRGKMKNKSLQLFGVEKMGHPEFLAVTIHEFAHFVDIYFLQKKVIQDMSEKFYEISWDATRVIKKGQKQKDFVSGYSMTNKYEDFAESFTYYLLHNKDFLEKAEKSEILQKKYNFFSVILFKRGEFQETDFSVGNQVLDYYRDTTKIDIDLEKLLQYLKNGIYS